MYEKDNNKCLFFNGIKTNTRKNVKPTFCKTVINKFSPINTIRRKLFPIGIATYLSSHWIQHYRVNNIGRACLNKNLEKTANVFRKKKMTSIEHLLEALHSSNQTIATITESPF